MPDATNKWFTTDDSDGVTPTGEIFRGPATEDEKKKINLVVKASSQEISGLKYPTEDVIGEWRVLRFVRSHLGDTEKAKKHFKTYLRHRKAHNHLIEELGREVRGMPPAEFTKWFEERRNPYLPLAPYAGESKDGSVVYFLCWEGGIQFEKWASSSTVDDPLTDDWAIMIQSHEWLLWYLNEQSKKLNEMCYMRKVLDLTGLSVNPFQFGGLQGLTSNMMKVMGIDYCDADDQFVMVNPPWIVDILFPIVKMFMTKRQKTKFQTIEEKEITTCVRPSCVPTARGGTHKPWSDIIYQPVNSLEIDEKMTRRRNARANWRGVIPKELSDLGCYEC